MPTDDFEYLAHPIARAVRLTGLSRSRIYELIKAGELEKIRVGGSALITHASLLAMIERRLPSDRDDRQGKGKPGPRPR